MTNFLPYVGCFLGGAACVGAWWWWIGHKAKVRALEQAALVAAKEGG